MFFTKKKKEEKTPTIINSEAFAQRAVKVINAELGKQIVRCGFYIAKIKSGEVVLSHKEQQNADGTTVENFTVGAFVVMAVKWSFNAFTIEVNSDEAILNAKRVRAGFKPSYIDITPPVIDLTARMSERDIAIEARAQEILKESNDKLLKNGKKE